MVLNDYPDKLKVEVEERNRIIEEIDKELSEINKKEQEINAKYESEEYKIKKQQENEAYSRKWVFEFFKELHPLHRDMTEIEYNEYISILHNEQTKKGYSILSYIRKENPKQSVNEDTSIIDAILD